MTASAKATVTALLAELGDRWETREKIAAARERLTADLPGWKVPAAYGLGVYDVSGELVFGHKNTGDHPLPAAVMATILGHEGGSESYEVDAATLQQAIRLLEPAGACRDYDHPNLADWKQVLKLLRGDRQLEARMVFVADFDDWRDNDDVDDLCEAVYYAAKAAGKAKPGRG
ncbi:hypothetical protein [Glycomyces tritici]|uniref:Uncharacterized protein n=1 Tax=Glycomyces tritici TaxID=2665176 RepID=A0ABT7YQT8_9ACTN|nr:hypothetical protein [Glycomyces tritici]MDN3240962.1 hypothetical protein [Glycomyces tritici]MDN3242835.1 hypothetical protein [Glycomyces tritici]